MAKISRVQIIFVICFIILYLLQSFILEPIIKEKYLSDDLKYFKIYSWKYAVSIFIVIAAIIIFRIRKSFKTHQIPGIILVLVFLGISFYFGVHSLIDNSILYINSITEGPKIAKAYEVVNHKEDKTFWLNSNNGSIQDKKDVEKINKSRIRKNLKSIFEYQNNDTVKVEFNKGLININYLE
ncbi:hypothetical protein [Chryseobacterium polytrichastri]|uniref:Uncharacterized protein n=1 Tax=Chryseobacterium polytrichastri TaxID=1302687 RepID=A0A1M6S661_9FLAO|nr:hypothetical protein [Chryseobacterium polytrichastri]SHK39997.1 hypothetical protein SAMN05444267_1003172 [Chryseobacterium polytrichastri]